MSIINVSSLVKDYRVRKKQLEKNGLLARVKNAVSPSTDKLRALKAVKFVVDAGEFIDYIGPNGPGKSTTIKLLTGVLTPTDGTAEVLGYIPWRQRKEYTRHIGVIFGEIAEQAGKQ